MRQLCGVSDDPSTFITIHVSPGEGNG
ncbi:hypothetical protein KL86DPRO_11269 [uncultured delta proteobacterium]|uniref:Uncharacterized protein n=1 Tax=uncultured delta proteobacterium TaxID=34034 RepID=A0A212JE95_9DELT|nr:hypothetical protein KL86DPRO_11269 [uncultured delta proteobacterium]